MADKDAKESELEHTWKCLEICQSILTNVSHEYHGLLDRLKPYIWVHNSELIQVSKKNQELTAFIKENIGHLSTPAGLIPARHLTFRLLQSLSQMKEACEKDISKKDAIIDGSRRVTRQI